MDCYVKHVLTEKVTRTHMHAGTHLYQQTSINQSVLQLSECLISGRRACNSQAGLQSVSK